MEEPWMERKIREAIESGELEPHDGVGEPIDDLDKPYDPTWWAKAFVKREKLKEYLKRGRAPRWEEPRDP